MSAVDALANAIRRQGFGLSVLSRDLPDQIRAAIAEVLDERERVRDEAAEALGEPVDTITVIAYAGRQRDQARREAAQWEEVAKRLLALLRRIEWQGCVLMDRDDSRRCPMCARPIKSERDPDGGHADGCELAEAIQ